MFVWPCDNSLSCCDNSIHVRGYCNCQTPLNLVNSLIICMRFLNIEFNLMAKRVLVYGGKGALGCTIVSQFKSSGWVRTHFNCHLLIRRVEGCIRIFRFPIPVGRLHRSCRQRTRRRKRCGRRKRQLDAPGRVCRGQGRRSPAQRESRRSCVRCGWMGWRQCIFQRRVILSPIFV